jgi:serine protease Do
MVESRGGMKIKLRSLGISLLLGSLVIVLPGNTQNADLSRNDGEALSEEVPAQLSEDRLYREAQSIAVRVLSSMSLAGSGTIVHAKGDTYYVLTNAHVLRSAQSPYQIQTPDGAIYQTKVITPEYFKKNDLEVLQFNAGGKTYAIAKFGTSAALNEGETVFAAGFPFSLENQMAPAPKQRKQAISSEYPPDRSFAFRTGKIVVVLDKALEGGYQVGYTNEIERGMSGGPLLNHAGELVGVNGMQSYPLWEATDYYEDGSVPSPPLQQLITRSNWAIPIERIVQPASAAQLW